MTLESTIESHLVKWVERHGGIALKGAIPGRRFLDRICIMPDGVTLWVECKRPKGGQRTVLQEETIRQLLELGHFAFFVKTKEDVNLILNGVRIFNDAGQLVVFEYPIGPGMGRRCISTPKGLVT